MNINNNSKLYLLCGGALAVVAGFGAYTILDKTENLVPVVVATQNIEPHTQITDKMVKIENVPALGRSENSVDDTGLVVGGYSTSKIYAGQNIIQPMITKQFDSTGASGLALSIPDENLRAIAFPTSPSQAVNGSLVKGDYVDVIVTLSGAKLKADTDITKTILQGVEIFDVGKDGGKIQSVTLLLTLEQIEIVKHAYSIGDVSYALNPGNPKTSRTTGIINKGFCERYNFNCSAKK